MPAAGQAFYAAYAQAYGATQDPYAVYGYEAMSVALQAIETVCAAHGDPASRAAIRDAVFSLKPFNDALGHWSLDAQGDTSLTDITVYQVIDGEFQVVAVSRAGEIHVE
jgi:branched-chain amino acid transport system substrate-binding protein